MQQDTERFLTGPQVRDRYGKASTTLWRWINDPKMGFPQPMKVNRLNHWKLSDLKAWEATQAENA